MSPTGEPVLLTSASTTTTKVTPPSLTALLDLITLHISEYLGSSSCQPPSLTYATLKKLRRKSHVDTLGRGFLKNSSKHSKSVASLLSETGDADLEITEGRKGLESGRRSNYSGSELGNPQLGLDVESGYSSIENNHLNNTLTANSCQNDHLKSTELTNTITDILRDKMKITSHFYSNILEQTVSFDLSKDFSSIEAEMMINNEKQFVARETEKVIYELRKEILRKVATLKEEKKLIENISLEIQNLLQSQKCIFKFAGFCNDLDIFLNLSVKVELKLNNLTAEESCSFTKLRLENQKENLKEIKTWLDQRRSVLEELLFLHDFTNENNMQESLQQIIEKKIRVNTQLCLGLENIRNLDNILIILNYM